MSITITEPADRAVTGVGNVTIDVTIEAAVGSFWDVWISREEVPAGVTSDTLKAYATQVVRIGNQGRGSAILSLSTADFSSLRDTYYLIAADARLSTGNYASKAFGTVYDRVPLHKTASARRPGPVTGLSVNISGTSAQLSWTAPLSTSTSDPATGYDTRYRSGTNPWSEPISAAGVTATVVGLSAQTVYTFQVRSKNNSGASDWVSVAGTTPAAPTPTGGVVSDAGWIPFANSPAEQAQLVYVSGDSLLRQDGTALVALHTDNGNPSGIVVGQYADSGVTRDELLVYDYVSNDVYRYRRRTVSVPGWRRDSAKDWSLGNRSNPSVGLNDIDKLNCFEALGRIWIPFREAQGAPGRRRRYVGHRAYSATANPSVQNERVYSEDDQQVPDFLPAYGNKIGVLHYARTLNSGEYFYFYDFVTTPATSPGGALTQARLFLPRGSDPPRNPSSGDPYLFAGVQKADEVVTFGGSSSARGKTPPPYNVVVEGKNRGARVLRRIQDSPSNPTSPDLSAYYQYRACTSPSHLYVCDLEADGASFNNVITAYSLSTGSRDDQRVLNIRSDVHPAGNPGAGWVVVSMYWSDDRDRLFLKFARWDGTSLNAPSDPWVCYEFANLTGTSWSGVGKLELTTAPSDFTGVSYMTTAGSDYWVLDSAANTVKAFNSAGALLPAGRFVDLVPENADPELVTSDGTYLYVSDGTDNKVYAYRIQDGQYFPTLDFDLARSDPVGMTYYAAMRTVYVVYSDGVDAYTLPSGAQPPSYTSAFDILLGNTGAPSGCATDGETLWVCYGDNNAIRAYDVGTKTRAAGRDIPAIAGTGSSYRGLAYDDGVLYALSAGDNRAYALDPAARLRLPARDFALFDTPASGLQAIALAGSRMYVIADVDGMEHIYVYDIGFTTTVPRQRETAAERWRALLAQVSRTTPEAARAGSDELPARDIGGNYREALRRAENAELGRAVLGVMYPRGQWAINDASGRPSDMTKESAALLISESPAGEGVTPATKPVYSVNESLITNQVTVRDFRGRDFQDIDPESVELWGLKSYSYDTDAFSTRTPDLADESLRRYGQPWPVLRLTADTLYEDAENSAALLWARPHSPVYVEYFPDNQEGSSENPWVILRRRVRITPTPGQGARAEIQYSLAPPRQLGIGWVLDSPVGQDVLDSTTILIDEEY